MAYTQKQRWSDIERATFSFGYGLMVTPLQLARVYATIGSLGVYRPLSITKVDPPVAGERVFPEPLVRTVVHMMESVALPGGGGVKAAIKGYRIAIKTGTAKKVGPDGKYVNRYIAYTAGVAPASNPVLPWWSSSTTRRVGNTMVAQSPRRCSAPSWAAYCAP